MSPVRYEFGFYVPEDGVHHRYILLASWFSPQLTMCAVD
jgi:hypothetical protein